MKISNDKKEDILKKNEKLASVVPILKSEFIGIDSAIDAVIDNMRPFYLLPETLQRPLVINLFGMTATGKTKLIERLVELLGLKSNFMKFDIGEYNGSDYRLRNELSNEISNVRTKNVIILFDEFQLGRTIDEKGIEIKSNSMRPVWDMLDSGKIMKINYTDYKAIFSLMEMLEKCQEMGVEVENGIVVKGESTYNSIFSRYSAIPLDFSLIDYKKLGWDEKKADDYIYSSVVGAKKRHLKKPYLIKNTFFDDIFRGNRSLFTYNYDFLDVREKFFKFNSIGKAIDFMNEQIIATRHMMIEEDYSKSLIFCVGNLDEAYAMHSSSDPDADADAFYEHSMKITVPIIKEALSKRFRMEQIGRMGNNHIIYPAFSKKSYQAIINKHIEIKTKYFADEFDVNMTFDPTVNDLLYKEGVFPSQGVRPLLSTFNMLIDTFVPKIISDVILSLPEADIMKWEFSDKDSMHIVTVSAKGKTKEFKYSVKLNIESLRKSDHSEAQAFVAVHEAGHAVLSCMFAGLIPKEVVSRTASTSEGFSYTQWPDVVTREIMYKQIVTSLGGLEAEKLIFGNDKISDGAHSDLSKATTKASHMVKAFGMANAPYILATAIHQFNEYDAIHDQGEAETQIKKIIREAQGDAKKCLRKNKKFLLEVAAFLSTNSKLEYDDFKKIALKYVDDKSILDKDKYHNFKETINTLSASEVDKPYKYVVKPVIKKKPGSKK